MAQSGTRIHDDMRGERRILSVMANGGQVLIQVEHAPGVWVTSDTITEDGASEIFFGEARVRIVPSGGATWEVH